MNPIFVTFSDRKRPLGRDSRGLYDSPHLSPYHIIHLHGRYKLPVLINKKRTLFHNPGKNNKVSILVCINSTVGIRRRLATVAFDLIMRTLLLTASIECWYIVSEITVIYIYIYIIKTILRPTCGRKLSG